MTASLLLGLALAAAAPAPKEAKKEAPTLVGRWEVVGTAKGGLAEPSTGGAWIEFTPDGKCRMKEGPQDDVEEGAYTQDAKADPPRLDITAPSKPGVPLPALYRFAGDTLTIAVCTGAYRPTKLESPPGSDVILVTLKRAKKG